MSCPFCEKKDYFYETPDFMVFETLEPRGKNHYLICPKKHIVTYENTNLLAQAHKIALKLAEVLKVESYKLVINTNAPCQTVFHAHMHFISDLKDFPGLNV